MTADGGLTVLAPLAIEQAALRRALPGVNVIRTGMGPERSRASAGRLPADGSPVAVAGFCGALDPRVQPGDVMVLICRVKIKASSEPTAIPIAARATPRPKINRRTSLRCAPRAMW